MITSSITGFGGASFAPAMAPEIAEVIETPPTERKKVSTDRNMKVEEYVRNYFSDIPVLVEVARCESRFRQYGEDGNSLSGEQNSLDKGVMQINAHYHDADADKLGYDINTLKGNTSYARVLYEKYGVKPWAPSSRCWAQTSAYAEHKELAFKK